MKLRAEDDPNWDIFDIKVTDTKEDALSIQEVADMQADMSPDEFAREMLNCFDAPVEGAFYTEALNALQSQGRVTRVTPDLNTSVITAWDLGMRHLAVRLAVPDLPAASFTGSTISRALASRSVTIPTFLASRRRPAASAIAHTCFHTT